MSKSNILEQKASEYDSNSAIKHEVNIALGAIKEFRQKYPFVENRASIEWLDPDKLYQLNPDQVGDFFHFIDTQLKNLAPQAPNSANTYRNARLQIKDFRNLLRTAVDERKTLAQKIDAPWDRIGGVGQDKTLAKKIIYVFNYETGKVLPIFSNQHLRHFAFRVSDSPAAQTKYFSPGQEYEHFTAELLKAKDATPLTRDWDTLYFTRFLYQTYPPPDSEPVGVNAQENRRVAMAVTNEQLDMQGFMKLLGELQKKHKISGEQFRDYRTTWTQQPSDRDALTQRLKRLLAA
jgi:hypothetical protein